ncbi:MAG: PAS domain S-box protein [Gemmataceae bacterium]|nr:PAS domain S-box protein [Gemmataceae bacterium]
MPAQSPVSDFARHQLALLETIFQHAPIGLAFVDRQFRYVHVNDVLARIDRRQPSEQIGRFVWEIVPDLWPRLKPLYERSFAGETIVNHEFSGPSPLDGQTRHWLVSYYPVRHGDEVIGAGVVVNDITDRKRAEDALATRTDLYEMLARTTRAVNRCRSPQDLYEEVCRIAVESGRFRFAWVGEPRNGVVRLVARAGDDGGYMDRIVITLDEADPRSHGPTGRAAVTGRSFVVNDFLASTMTKPWHAEARRVGIAASAAFPFHERGEVVAVFTLYAPEPGFFTDDLVATLGEITPIVSFALDSFVHDRERRRDEAELRFRDRALQNVSQGIVILDPRTPGNPIIYANPGFQRMTGYSAEELIGLDGRFLIGAFTDPATVAEVDGALRDGHDCAVEMELQRKDGTPFWSSLTISPMREMAEAPPTHFVAVLADITEKRRLESLLRQSQKMEAIGQLAGGIAHDFNNLLTIITGYGELVLDTTPKEDARRPYLEEIVQAGERSTALTRQLLAFSRKQVLAPKDLNLNDVIRQTEKMLRRIIGEDVVLETRLAPNLATVRADPGQVEQVLLNLAVNARDAMPRGGRITVSTANVELPDDPVLRQDGLNAGVYVRLSVSDTGEGMTEHVRARLFEPFFTTKGAGKGTGLGLAVVHGIVRQSDGAIRVQSEPGQGTTFQIDLPRVAGAVVAAAPKPLPAAIPHGTGTILLVEDEDGVRTLVRFILEQAGYDVLDAASGLDAIRIAREHAGLIRLLITDVVMPGLDGRALSEQIATLHPGIRMLFLSGYTDDAVLRYGVRHDQVDFLQKPFTPLALVGKVHDVVSRGTP